MSTLTATRKSWSCQFLCTLVLLSLGSFAFAQDNNEEMPPEATLQVHYSAVNNQSKVLKATIITETEDGNQPAYGVFVNFYQQEVDPGNLLGKVTTNAKGIATLVISNEQLSSSTSHTFIITTEEDTTYPDLYEEITVAEAKFTMELGDDRQITLSLQAPDSMGTMSPVYEADIYLYVQRMFGLLPFPDNPEMTDETGAVSLEFPADIPGDSSGNLIIVARVEEHDLYGNLEFRRKANWGVPVITNPPGHQRELWSSRANAPLYLIILVNAILIGVWGVIGYVIYTTLQLKKAGSQLP